MADVALRLAGAAVLGGVMGLECEWLQKPAGLRTHMLVALGSAMFVLAPREVGMDDADLSRVMLALVILVSASVGRGNAPGADGGISS